MTHILFIYKQFPAPSVGHAGGESLFRMMRALHERGHRLSLVARILDEEKQHLPSVHAICDHVATVPHHGALNGPRMSRLVHSYLALRRAAAHALQTWQPDLVHIETLQTAIAVLGLRRPPASYRTQDVNWFLMQQAETATTTASVAETTTNVVTTSRSTTEGDMPNRSLFARIKRRGLQWLELWVARQHELVVAISEGDRRLLAPGCPSHDVLLLPLAPGVTPRPDVRPAVAPGPNLLFVGAMYRDHNLRGVNWFLDDIWPRVLTEVPEARFYIVGNKPPASLRARQVPDHIIVTGFVDELAPWYEAAEVFICPLLIGGGLLQKVMDAMVMGVPVIATSGSNHGIGGTPGEHLLIADTPEGFSQAVVRLLRDPAARAELGAAGQRFIQTHYDADAAFDRWDAALRALL